MNSGHGLALSGGSGLAGSLAIVLAHYPGLDTDTAAALASLIIAALGILYALVAWFVSWKWPTVPPLPPIQHHHEPGGDH